MFSQCSQLPLGTQRWLPIRPCGSLHQPISSHPQKQKIYIPHRSWLLKIRRKKKVTLFICTLNKENFRIDFTSSFKTDWNPPEKENSTQETGTEGGRGTFKGGHSASILAPSIRQPSALVTTSGEGWEPAAPDSLPHVLEHAFWETVGSRGSERGLGNQV